jgi:transposase-like protein
MMGFPTTLFGFESTFPDEAACWRYLRRARWPRGFRCPRCGHARSYPLRARELAQCRCCRYQASLTAGTIFHNTQIPLRIWFLAIFFVARHKQGISALQLQKDTGLGSYRTAWLLLHKIRAAMRHGPGELLNGLVEGAETDLGALHETDRAGGRAAGRKTLVGLVVERRRRRGRARLDVLESHGFREIGPFVRGAVEPGRTTLRTDGLDGYRPLAREGIRHERVVQGPDSSRGPRILPFSHMVFSHLKSWLRGTHRGVSRKHLPRYLDEFAFRFSYRDCTEQLGDLILERIAGRSPFPLHRLTAEGSA